jgi:hypothetical protein
MSGHADTIRRVLQQLGLPRYGQFERPAAQEGLDALDALVAEIQQLRDALEDISSGGWQRYPNRERHKQTKVQDYAAWELTQLPGTPSEDT